MLPMHGGYGYGKRGRGGGTNPLLITVVVLAVLTALFGLGAWSAHSKSAKLQKELKTLRGAQSHSEDQLTHQRSLYQHLEYEYHTLQRRVNDMTREMQSKDHMLQLRSQEKDACTNSENILQQVAKELQEQVNYERAIVEVHKQKLTQLESAHRQREADWQALSKTWAKFETDATKENTRLLLELAKATQNNGTQAAPTQSPSPHQLPDPEPRTRPESAFNTQVELPKEEDFVHHMKAAEEYIKAQQLKMQQQQHGGNGAQPQQHQPAGQQHSATTIPPLEGMGHQENVGGGHAQQNQQGQQAHGMQGGGHREGVGRHLAADNHGSHDDHYGHNDHKAPEDWHAHHGHHYEDDPNAWFDPDHLDPLDRYWINDDFNKDAWENHHQHDEHNTHHDAAHVNGHTPTPKNHDSHHQQPQQQYHPSQYEHQPTQHQQHQGQQHQPTQNQQHSGQGNQHGYQPVQQQQYHGNVAPEVHDWKQQQQGNGHQVPQNQAPHQQHGGHGSVPQPVPQHNPHLLPRHTGGAPQPQQHQQGGNNYSPHPHA